MYWAALCLHWTGQSSRYMPGDFKTLQQRDRQRQRRACQGGSHRLRYHRLAAKLRRSRTAITKSSNGSSASRDRPGSIPSPGRAGAVFRCRLCAIARKMQLFAEACTKTRLSSLRHGRRHRVRSRTSRRRPSTRASMSGRPAFTAATATSTAAMCTPSRRRSTSRFRWQSQTGNFELKTNSKVCRINSDASGQVTGVSYFDAAG